MLQKKRKGVKTMTKKQVIEIVRDNIEKQAEVTMESRLASELDVDSIGLVILLNAFEDELDMEISDDLFKDIDTVHDIWVRINEFNARR